LKIERIARNKNKKGKEHDLSMFHKIVSIMPGYGTKQCIKSRHRAQHNTPGFGTVGD